MSKTNQRKSKPSNRPDKTPQPPEPAPPPEPVLRFSLTAWAKLLYFRDHKDVEIGGFGVTRADDLLYVEDFQTVKQAVTAVSIAFEDDAVADFFDQQVDTSHKPEQFARVWLHSHPGDSPEPSSVDEETFNRVFGRCDWVVMFILAASGITYARLRFSVGPGGQLQIPVHIDFGRPFAGSDHQAWQAEYESNIRIERFTCDHFGRQPEIADDWDDWPIGDYEQAAHSYLPCDEIEDLPTESEVPL